MSIHYLRLFLINPHYYSLHILLIDPKKKNIVFINPKQANNKKRKINPKDI